LYKVKFEDGDEEECSDDELVAWRVVAIEAGHPLGKDETPGVGFKHWKKFSVKGEIIEVDGTGPQYTAKFGTECGQDIEFLCDEDEVIDMINYFKIGPKTRGRACGKCSGCKKDDCGECANCLDKPERGGPGRRKQRCKKRECKYKVYLPRKQETTKTSPKKSSPKKGSPKKGSPKIPKAAASMRDNADAGKPARKRAKQSVHEEVSEMRAQIAQLFGRVGQLEKENKTLKDQVNNLTNGG
jgi:hypothetical protein